MLFGGVGRKERRRRARERLESVGLADRVEHKPTELSGGQMQRVAIARALAMEPDIVLADEPTGNLDTGSGSDVMGALQELWQQGQHAGGGDPRQGPRATRQSGGRDP